MPALLLHMTIAEDLARQYDVEEGARASETATAASQELDAVLLGSILPDLPYHASFGHQMVRHLLKRGYLASEWSDLFHTRQVGGLALALLTHVVRAQLQPKRRRRVVALIAGYLCHCALDTMVHPEINRAVDSALEAGASRLPDVLHAEVERLHSLIYHHDLLGYDIAGSAYPRQLTGRMAGAGLFRPRLDDALWRAFRVALLQAHGRAPSPAEFGDWLWGVTAYGHVMSSPMGSKFEALVGDIDELREVHFRGPAIDLETPLSRGRETTLEYWQAADDVLAADRITADVRTVFLQRVPDVDLSLGV